MSHVILRKDGTFDPLPREQWEAALGATACPICHEKAAFYRITHDDYLCANCGKMIPRQLVE